MRIQRVLTFATSIILLSAAVVMAQYPVVSVQDVKSMMTGKKKAVLIDSRSPEEYREGHIPGAINIPAEEMKAQAGHLPSEKSRPLIFYCRGAG